MNNNMSSNDHSPDFDIDKAKYILSEIIRTCNQPENSRKLSQAKAAAGKEMLLIMQNVFPLVMQLQMDVIKAYGFASNREGLLQFAQVMHELEREDEDIARLRHQIRTIYLPPIAVNSDNFVSNSAVGGGGSVRSFMNNGVNLEVNGNNGSGQADGGLAGNKDMLI